VKQTGKHNTECSKPIKQTEEDRLIESSGDTGIDFLSVLKDIFTK
jgi:hypothetical protein